MQHSFENALSPSRFFSVAVDDDEHSGFGCSQIASCSIVLARQGPERKSDCQVTGLMIDIKSESQAEEEGLFDEIDFSAAEETEQSEETAQDNEVQE